MDTPTTPILPPQPAIATMKIVSDETDLGYQIINASEFDKATMKKYTEPKAAPDAPAA